MNFINKIIIISIISVISIILLKFDCTEFYSLLLHYPRTRITRLANPTTRGSTENGKKCPHLKVPLPRHRQASPTTLQNLLRSLPITITIATPHNKHRKLLLALPHLHRSSIHQLSLLTNTGDPIKVF